MDELEHNKDELISTYRELLSMKEKTFKEIIDAKNKLIDNLHRDCEKSVEIAEYQRTKASWLSDRLTSSFGSTESIVPIDIIYDSEKRLAKKVYEQKAIITELEATIEKLKGNDSE